MKKYRTTIVLLVSFLAISFCVYISVKMTPSHDSQVGVLTEKDLLSKAPGESSSDSVSADSRPVSAVVARELAVFDSVYQPLVDDELIPEEMLFAEALDRLLESAKAGNAKAADRLVADAKCCRSLPLLTTTLVRWSDQPSEFAAQWIPMMSRDIVVLEKRCGLVPGKLVGSIFDFEQIAVAASAPQASIEWLQRRVDTPLRLSIEQRIAALSEFKLLAMSRLQTLIKQGNLDALVLYGSIYSEPEKFGDLGSLVLSNAALSAGAFQAYLESGARSYPAQVRERLNRIRSSGSFDAVSANRVSAALKRSSSTRRSELFVPDLIKGFRLEVNNMPPKCPVLETSQFGNLTFGTQLPAKK